MNTFQLHPSGTRSRIQIAWASQGSQFTGQSRWDMSPHEARFSISLTDSVAQRRGPQVCIFSKCPWCTRNTAVRVTERWAGSGMTKKWPQSSSRAMGFSHLSQGTLKSFLLVPERIKAIKGKLAEKWIHEWGMDRMWMLRCREEEKPEGHCAALRGPQPGGPRSKKITGCVWREMGREAGLPALWVGTAWEEHVTLPVNPQEDQCTFQKHRLHHPGKNSVQAMYKHSLVLVPLSGRFCHHTGHRVHFIPVYTIATYSTSCLWPLSHLCLPFSVFSWLRLWLLSVILLIIHFGCLVSGPLKYILFPDQHFFLEPPRPVWPGWDALPTKKPHQPPTPMC